MTDTKQQAVDEAYVTFELHAQDRNGRSFTALYDSRRGFNLRGDCWNKDLALIHDMISSCTAFTRIAETANP